MLPSITWGMNPSLKYVAFSALLAFAPLAVSPAVADSVSPSSVGLQLYSLRNQFAKDVPGTLAEIQGWHIRNVELAGTYGLTTGEFKDQLKAHGLRPVSAHYGYDQFRTNLDWIVSDARALGLKYAGCAWIPHGEQFDEKTCREAIEVFNHAGEVLAAHGVKFFSHTHGYEFAPYKDGTFFDLIMAETNPKYVCFEMDIFWVASAGINPTDLMKKYGSRWQLMHLKGMKEGTPTGLFTGHSDVNNDVPLGQGQIQFPPLLKAAANAGVKYYFIEDESDISEKQIPVSLEYLHTLSW
jgi:sugar phosphate isomerase/epimerase